MNEEALDRVGRSAWRYKNKTHQFLCM